MSLQASLPQEYLIFSWINGIITKLTILEHNQLNYTKAMADTDAACRHFCTLFLRAVMASLKGEVFNDELKFKGDAMADKMELKKSVEYARDSIVSKQLINKKTGTVTLFAFYAGQSLSEHTAPYDAALQVLEGSADITIGGEPFKLKEGEMIVMPANVPHSVRADENLKIMLVMILS